MKLTAKKSLLMDELEITVIYNCKHGLEHKSIFQIHCLPDVIEAVKAIYRSIGYKLDFMVRSDDENEVEVFHSFYESDTFGICDHFLKEEIEEMEWDDSFLFLYHMSALIRGLNDWIKKCSDTLKEIDI